VLGRVGAWPERSRRNPSRPSAAQRDFHEKTWKNHNNVIMERGGRENGLIAVAAEVADCEIWDRFPPLFAVAPEEGCAHAATPPRDALAAIS